MTPRGEAKEEAQVADVPADFETDFPSGRDGHRAPRVGEPLPLWLGQTPFLRSGAPSTDSIGEPERSEGRIHDGATRLTQRQDLTRFRGH